MHSEDNKPFSRRHGYHPEEREIIVRHDAPEELRGSMLQIASDVGMTPRSLREVVCRVLRRLPDPNNWSEYPNIWEEVQSLILSCDWFRIYDVAEALYRYLKGDVYSSQADDFQALLNDYFREAGIGWKMEDGEIVVRGSEIFEATVQGVTSVLNNHGRATASNEIHEAIRDISRRPEPDISGSIQHAMAALECVARDICGDTKLTLGDLLKRYPDRLSIPKPLDEAVSKAWGYASEMARHIREGRDPRWEDAELVVGIAAILAIYLTKKVTVSGSVMEL
jgi:hypothetical protein